MKLFEFYRVDESSGKTLIFTYDNYIDNNASARFFCILFGLSTPPHLTSLYYNSSIVEATKKDIDNVLKFRYKSLIQFVFEEM